MYLFDVGSGQEEGGFHEEEALPEREQGPLVDSVVALHEAGEREGGHRTHTHAHTQTLEPGPIVYSTSRN